MDNTLLEEPGLNSLQEMPSGTLTYLFTDIEGSTHLWEQFPEQIRVCDEAAR